MHLWLFLRWMKNNIDKQKGIYIHIPFCSSKCLSCEFKENYQNRNLINRYIDALIKDFDNIDTSDKITTVYIGGGTPSTLDAEQLLNLLKNLNKKIDLSNVEEFTIEARVEDLNIEKINILKEYGVNRVSLFVQHLDRDIEYLLGPGSNEVDVLGTIQNLLNVGINNLSVDLMFAVPNQTISDLKRELDKIIRYNVEHISIYPMTLDERVEDLAGSIDSSIQVVDEKLEIKMYNYIIEYLSKNGFKHYELSNFSKNNKIAIHNSNYWKNFDYYGVGAEAHGKISGSRYKNSKDILEYIQKIESDVSPKTEKINLSFEEQIEEEFYLGLQLLEGINLNVIDNKYNINSKLLYKDVLIKNAKKGTLLIENNIVRINPREIDKFSEIVSDFLLS